MSYPGLKLIYFKFGGRAESIRMTLHVGGVPFEDVRITEEVFLSMKAEGKFPFGSVPVLEVNKGDGASPETYAQSVGILRYVGRIGGLYPDDALEGLAVDQVVGGVEDMIVDTVPFLFAPEADKAAMKEKLEKHTYPKFFTAFEKLLEQHGKDYFCGPKITVADLAVYPVLQWITMSIVDASILSPYPLLSAVMQRIRSHPKVAEYLVMDQEGKHGQ